MELSALPDVLDEVIPAVRAAARSILGPKRQELQAAAGRVAAGGDSFIPVTDYQWGSVLWDAGLPDLWAQLRSAGLALVFPARLTPFTVGKQLPKLARTVSDSAELLYEVASEVSQFIPPDTRIRDAQVVTRLATHGLVFAEAVAECAALGWDPDTWSRARAAALKADNARSALEAAQEQVVDLGNDLAATCKLCLGLPAEQLLAGNGVAFTSRLAAAVRAAGLADFDERLRRQTRHLIGPEQPLDDKLRRHLATLAISERPLLSHRATTQSLELVSRAIAGDPASAYRAIAEHVPLEPTALSTHSAQQNANRRLRQAQHAEDRMRPIADMYKATADGDIVRTAKVVLALLGKTVPPRLTLAAARDRLRAQADQPLCALLASTVRPEWRNAIAHEEIEWNDVQNTAVFAGNQVDLDHVLDLTYQARLIFQGFERAVAVAYARTPPPMATSTRVSANLAILDILGETGQPVLDLRRSGTSIVMQVPSLSITNIPTLLAAVTRGFLADPSIEQWTVNQDGNLPSLHLDRAAAESAVDVANDRKDQMPETVLFNDASLLPLIANGLVNAEAGGEVVAATIVALAAEPIADERERLRGSLLVDDLAAASHVLDAAAYASRGVRLSGQFVPTESRGKLNAFAQILDGIQQRVAGAAPHELLDELKPVDRALRRNTVHLPWVEDVGRGALV